MKLDTGNLASSYCGDDNSGGLEKLIELYNGLKSSTINPYELFGLDKAAKTDEIRAAFLSFTVAFHPNRIFSLAVAEIRQMADFVFAAANQAFEILSEEDDKQEYDEDDVRSVSGNFKKQNKNW